MCLGHIVNPVVDGQASPNRFETKRIDRKVSVLSLRPQCSQAPIKKAVRFRGHLPHKRGALGMDPSGDQQPKRPKQAGSVAMLVLA